MGFAGIAAKSTTFAIRSFSATGNPDIERHIPSRITTNPWPPESTTPASAKPAEEQACVLPQPWRAVTGVQRPLDILGFTCSSGFFSDLTNHSENRAFDRFDHTL
jgi:hypothetical protein